MSRIILRVTERGWFVCPMKCIWKIRNDGTFSFQKVCKWDEEKPTVIQGILKPEDFKKLTETVDEPWPDEPEPIAIDDAPVWDFRTYGPSGKLEKCALDVFVDRAEPFRSIISVLDEIVLEQ